MPWSTVELKDGRKIPQIAFGSAAHSNESTSDIINQAIDVGFDHIDTAQMYGNEKEVGQGIKESGLARKDVWITTKWSGYAPIKQSIQESLEKLGVEYVDLYLIHNSRICNGDIKGAWAQFEEVYKLGYAKSIGVSNFSIEQLEEVHSVAKVKPVINQILLHPGVWRDTAPLIEYHTKQHIVTEGYSPLRPLRDVSAPNLVKVVSKLAEKKGVKPETILLAWNKAKGAIPITSSSVKERMEGYIAAGDLALTAEDVEEIDRAGVKSQEQAERRQRIVRVTKVLIGAGAVWWTVSRYL